MRGIPYAEFIKLTLRKTIEEQLKIFTNKMNSLKIQNVFSLKFFKPCSKMDRENENFLNFNHHNHSIRER